jgi:O-antigen/teichoic acid export membrane protein
MLKNTAIYLLCAILQRASSLLLVPILTWSLSPGDFGALELLNRVAEVLFLFLFANGIGLAAIAFYNQATTDEARRRVVGSILALGFSFIGIIGITALLFAGRIGAWIGAGGSSLVWLALLAALADAPASVCLTLIQARVQAARYTAFVFSQNAVRVVVIALCVCLFHWGVFGILVASLLTSGVFTLILLTLELKQSGFHVDRATLFGVAWFALPFLPGGICGMILGSGDQLLLVKHSSASELGLYALGYKMAAMVSALTLAPMMKVWGARMHQVAREPNAPQIFGGVFTRFTFAYLFVGLGLALFAPEVITVLSRSEYLGAVEFIAPVVLAYFFMSGSDLMDAAFYVKRRSHVKLWISLLSAAVMMALYLVLIPPFKGLGAAYATLAGFAARMGLTYFVSQRLFRVAYEWNRVAMIVIAAVGCWGLGQFAVGPFWVTVPAKTMILFLFPTVLWLTGQATPLEKLALFGFLDRIRVALGKWGGTITSPAREM